MANFGQISLRLRETKMRPRKNKSSIRKLAALVSLFSCLIVLAAIPAHPVQATPGMNAFGGILLYRDIGSPPPAFCPAHIAIFDYRTNMVFGIMEGPGSRIYSYGNLVTPSVHILGESLYVPIPCARYYPLYPIFQIGTAMF